MLHMAQWENGKQAIHQIFWFSYRLQFVITFEQMLADVEDHLNITITQVNSNMQVPVNEFDGKVIYGEKLLNKGTNYEDHVKQLKPVVENLSELESKAQLLFLKHMKVH